MRCTMWVGNTGGICDRDRTCRVAMPIPSLTEFKDMLRTATADTITADVVLAEGALHVSGADLDFIRQQILDAFGLLPGDVEVIVVGSAKLGFSLVEKDRPVYKPRYRSFDVESDIDIAVISSKLYSTCWRELSNF